MNNKEERKAEELKEAIQKLEQQGKEVNYPALGELLGLTKQAVHQYFKNHKHVIDKIRLQRLNRKLNERESRFHEIINYLKESSLDICWKNISLQDGTSIPRAMQKYKEYILFVDFENTNRFLTKAFQVAKNRNGECLSLTYEGAMSKMNWKCSEGHVWSATYHNVVDSNKSWCPHCKKTHLSKIKRKVK